MTSSNSLYGLTYNFDTYTQALLPINKRQTKHVKWLEALNSQTKWLNQNLNEYIYGVSYSTWSASATYSLYQRVKGGIINSNFVYESIASTHSGQPLNDAAYWQIVNNNFIGVDERMYYMDQKMTFEYALNRWFQTTFRQNTGVTMSGTQSDIYIEDNVVYIPAFIVGSTEIQSSVVYPTSSSGYIIDSLTFYPNKQFNIYVPNAVLATIPGTASGVRNFADKYNIAGIYYDVIGY